MKSVVRSLAGVVCLLFALSGCRTSSPTFTYTPEMQVVHRQAEAGDVCAMRRMASYCWTHPGPSCSHEEACRWIARAADEGDASACELMGWCTLMGDGVPRDRELAARYFLRAGSIYWDHWVMVFAYDEAWPIDMMNCWRGRRLNGQWLRDEDLLLAVGNLNRAILLGSVDAQRIMAVLYLHLARHGHRCAFGSEDASKYISFTSHDFCASLGGRFPGLSDLMTVSQSSQGDSPYQEAEMSSDQMIALARSIAAKRTFHLGDYDLPQPNRIVYQGLLHGNEIDPVEGPGYARRWRVVDVVYGKDDDSKVNRAFSALDDSYARSGVIVRLQKCLPIFYKANGRNRTRDLVRRLTEEAKISEDEEPLLMGALIHAGYCSEDE